MQWECDRCGELHESNPGECRNCGHTVFTQRADVHEPASPPTPGGDLGATGGDSDGLELLDIAIILLGALSILVAAAALAGIVP